MDSNKNASIKLTKFNTVHDYIMNKDKSNDIYKSTIDESSNNVPKETITQVFQQCLQKNPKFEIIKYKSDASLNHFDVTLTVKDYSNLILNAARSFLKIGLDCDKAVGILGFNHVAWFVSELAAIFNDALACGIYTTNSAELVKFIVNDCQCQILVVENKLQFDKVISILPDCPSIKAIIQYDGNQPNYDRESVKIPIFTWTEFLDLTAKNASKEEIEELNDKVQKRHNQAHPDKCAMLIYTSGTTGNPKGVILSHDNVLYASRMGMRQIKIKPFCNRIISYLPLSHVAANVVDLISSIVLGFTVYFAQPDALKGTIAQTLKEVRPTIFLGVPRVFEKIQEAMQEIGANTTGIKLKIASWAKSVGYRNNIYKVNGKNTDVSYCFAKCLVFSKIKNALGLDECSYLASAAAPLSKETLDYFMSLDMFIHQIYGMSECSGPQTIGKLEKMCPGSAGSLMIGSETLLANVDENGVGEICMRGRHVFLGYYNNPEKTKETLDEEGWLHSGDLGKIVGGEFLYITGRIKELIITAGGENVAPVPMEDSIKALLPFVSNVMLVGDKMKFISCLMTLKTQVDAESQLPTNKLTGAAIRSLKELGIEASNTEQVITEPISDVLKKHIDSAIKKANEDSISRAACVQKWKLIERDFSIPGGELGPTLKMKRPVIHEIYKDVIKSMY